MPRQATCPFLASAMSMTSVPIRMSRTGRGGRAATAQPPPYPHPYAAVAAGIAGAERRDVLLLVECHVVDDEDVRVRVALREALGRELRFDRGDDAVVDERLPDLGSVLEREGLERRQSPWSCRSRSWSSGPWPSARVSAIASARRSRVSSACSVLSSQSVFQSVEARCNCRAARRHVAATPRKGESTW